MSTLRHRFRLVLDGRDLGEIVTSARDLAAVEVADGEDGDPTEQTLRLLHHACIRLGLDGIPDTWDEFADRLDEMENLSPNGTPARAANGTDLAVPTHAAG